MDKKEAKAILAEEIEKLREETYSDLCKYKTVKGIKLKEVHGKSGTCYYLEIESFLDDKKSTSDNLRVSVTIHDGGWRSFFPLCDSFIMASDGSFVGEDV